VITRLPPAHAVLLTKLAVAMLLLLTAAGCTRTAACPPETPVPGSSVIPPCIRERADRIVISRLGKAFFQEHVIFQPASSSYNAPEPTCVQDPSGCAGFLLSPYYRMVYTYQVPDLPGRDLTTEFLLDAAGNLITEAGPLDLPDCVHDPQECRFSVVDAASAIVIAREAGLEPGLVEWRTDFHWYGGELNTYVWTVDNTLTSESGGRQSGNTLIIDANSGKVLQMMQWEAIP